jgi:hypothetical protein
MRARVLAFNAVGVVGIHAAQQHMQLWRHTLARQGRGRTHQVTGLGQQSLLPGVRGQQGFKLVGRVVARSHSPSSWHSQIIVFKLFTSDFAKLYAKFFTKMAAKCCTILEAGCFEQKIGLQRLSDKG